MPELPEVETVRLSLKPHLTGRCIENVLVRETRLREKVDGSLLRELLIGQHIQDIKRRGKYLIIELSDGRSLIIHFGMSGRLYLVPSNQPVIKHEHIHFVLDNQEELRFYDPRRFGLVEAIEKQTNVARKFSTLGPEPLGDSFSVKYLYDKSRHLKKPIKNFLMDDKMLVGIGNIYASEALYLAHVHPKKPAGKLNEKTWKQLHAAIRKVLHEAIAQGGTTLNDFRNGFNEAGYFQVKLRVYDRQGKPCRRCKTAIRRIVLAGRSTYFCPQCQSGRK